jgi:hypothetical protein
MVYKLDVSYSSSQMLTSKFGHLLKSTFFRAEQDIDALSMQSWCGRTITRDIASVYFERAAQALPRDR